MNACYDYGVNDFGGKPRSVNFRDDQYPSKIFVSIYNDCIQREEKIYIPLKTSKISIQANAYGELLPCKCGKCRNKVKPWDKYCSNCGAKLQLVSTSDISYPQYWESIDEEKSE